MAVHADYTFVHPVTPARGSTEVTGTIVCRVLDVELRTPPATTSRPVGC
ncbi:hypothetical protein [Streptomyces antibioticus]